MTDFSELRKGLPEAPWITDCCQVRVSTTIGSFWLATCSTETTARAVASIPDMLTEIERLQRLQFAVENKQEAAVLLMAEVDRLHALNAEMREALAGVTYHHDDPAHVRARAILAKTEEA